MKAAPRKTGLLLGAAIVVLGFAAWLLMGHQGLTTDSVPLAAQPAATARQAEPCSRVLKCAAPQAIQQASASCRPAIEQLAAFAPRWTQGLDQPIFTDYAWLNESQGTITYFGNRAEFQNADGVFATVAYECDFDPASSKVLDARAKGAATP